MTYPEEIKKICQKSDISAMKKIKDFCDAHNLDFSALEEQWMQTGKGE